MTKSNQTKILIVEDEMIIAADLSIQLTKLGYDVMGIHTRAEDLLKTLEESRPDLILMDIILSGEMNGIDAAKIILDRYQIPVIFLTSNTNDATFQEAKTAKPYAFISKPFRKDDLSRAIEITIERISFEGQQSTDSTEEISMIDDRLFVRHKDQLVKVAIHDILYLEADRSYCKLVLTDREYLLSIPMGSVESTLPVEKFVRVHRSFIVNLLQIDAISENHESITVGSHSVPISRRMKDVVIKRLRMI